MLPYRRRRVILDDRVKGIGGNILGLSMFIMLLAFFIVLNAISTVDEVKFQSIQQNLGEVFASRITQSDNLKPSVSESEEKALNEGSAVERVEALLKSRIAGTETVASKSRGVIYIKVSRKEFEDAIAGIVGSGEKTEFAVRFLPTLISILHSEGRSISYRMDVTYNLPENPARLYNQSPQEMLETISKVSAVVETIEQAGMPTHLMTVGLQKGDPEFVEILIQPHIPINPESEDSLPGEAR